LLGTLEIADDRRPDGDDRAEEAGSTGQYGFDDHLPHADDQAGDDAADDDAANVHEKDSLECGCSAHDRLIRAGRL
jgi:hypothetical protein